MQLYSMPATCAVGVHIALEWSQLPYSVEVLRPGEQRRARYLALNPMAVVPTLALDDGEVLSEASAILCYIDDLAPDRFAPGPSPKDKARLRQSLSFLSCELHPAFRCHFRPSMLHPEQSEHKTLRVMARTRIERLLTLMEARLQAPYLFGERRSVADAYLFSMLSWLERTRIDPKSFSKLREFVDRMADDPRVQRVLENYDTGKRK
ncbi:MAG: glutathione S-transferase N-terminal domain-containing protein [Pseudomonadota bacterium]